MCAHMSRGGSCKVAVPRHVHVRFPAGAISLAEKYLMPAPSRNASSSRSKLLHGIGCLLLPGYALADVTCFAYAAGRRREHQHRLELRRVALEQEPPNQRGYYRQHERRGVGDAEACRPILIHRPIFPSIFATRSPIAFTSSFSDSVWLSMPLTASGDPFSMYFTRSAPAPPLPKMAPRNKRYGSIRQPIGLTRRTSEPE